MTSGSQNNPVSLWTGVIIISYVDCMKSGHNNEQSQWIFSLDRKVLNFKGYLGSAVF